MDERVERFVPTGKSSLVDDAPGWSPKSDEQQGGNSDKIAIATSTQGPICWKCRGSGLGKIKQKNNSNRKRRRKQDNNAAVQEQEQDPPDNNKQTPTTTVSTTDDDKPNHCSVCHGKGHLPAKQQEVLAKQHRPGEITRIRQCPKGWKPKGPLPRAMEERQEPSSYHENKILANDNNNHNLQEARRLVQLAESTHKEILVKLPTPSPNFDDNDATNVNTNSCTVDHTTTENNTNNFETNQPIPVWLPRRGEQLCNLVGQWRILQRVASHRWTTDDLVTSYMAGMVLQQQDKQLFQGGFRYLDLGCGNGSVLLMTTWQLMAKLQQQTTPNASLPLETNPIPLLTCTGIEARHEAVQLARRSIAFNVGDNKEDSVCNDGKGNPQPTNVEVKVHHGDFRTVLDTLLQQQQQSGGDHEKGSRLFDLVTGTPPYFRVDFTVASTTTNDANNDEESQQQQQQKGKTDSSNDKVVRQAVINQGGMPTCKQSAPARCEFRGGIEAYCQAASTAMHSQSLFCVCENWLNNDRVYEGAKQAGLVVIQVLPVSGRTGKPSPLFAVYVMRKREYFEGGNGALPATQVLDCVAVRDDSGNWTPEYQKVLEAMSIPVVPLQPSS